jgi:hypothetical protein
MEQKRAIDDAFDVGAWVGRSQAFALVAGRCSAADAEILFEIRVKKLFRTTRAQLLQKEQLYSDQTRGIPSDVRGGIRRRPGLRRRSHRSGAGKRADSSGCTP